MRPVKPFPAAVILFASWCTWHWLALPILMTFDGFAYINLADLFGSPQFGAHWDPIRTPGFPFALDLAMSLFGRNALAVKAVPLIMGAAGTVLVASAMRRLFGELAGVVTLVVLALDPTLVAFEHMILVETGAFFFLALTLRLAVWQPRTPRAAWIRAASLALAIAAGYLWRQTTLAVLPWIAITQLIPAFRKAAGKRDRIGALLQTALVIVVPITVMQLWSSRIAAEVTPGMLAGYAAHAGAVPQGELQSFERRDPKWTSSWTRLVSRNWKTYAGAVARTLRLFAGLEREEGEVIVTRRFLLTSAESVFVRVKRDGLVLRNHLTEFHETVGRSRTQRFLLFLCKPRDVLMIVCSFATVILFFIALIRRDLPLLHLSAIPLSWTFAHAALVMTIDRYIMPAQPIMFACGIALVLVGLSRLAKRVEKRNTEPFEVA